MKRKRPLRGGILRKLIVVTAILVVLAVVGAVVFVDSIVKTGIAAAGTHVLGTRTAVKSVSLGIVSGKTTVEGLEIDNPPGYADVKFLALESVSVEAPFSQLTGDKIVIDRIAFRGLTLDIEKGADGKLNVQQIVDHLKKTTGADRQKEATQPDGPQTESKEALVKELRLEKLKVNLRNIAGGNKGVVAVELPDIVLRDLSSKGGVDVLSSEISGIVIGSVTKAVIAANIEGLGSEVIGGLQGAVEGVGGVIGDGLRGAVDTGIKGAEEALKGVGKGAGELMKGAGGLLKEGAKGVGDAIEGVFGGKKK